MKRKRINSNFTEDSTEFGTTYLYSCTDDEYLLNIEGYPEAIEVECVEPDNYRTEWTYNSWKNGYWTNIDLIAKGCFDPDLCYDRPPLLPNDNSVSYNVSESYQALPIGSLVKYFCSEECKILN